MQHTCPGSPAARKLPTKSRGRQTLSTTHPHTLTNVETILVSMAQTPGHPALQLLPSNTHFWMTHTELHTHASIPCQTSLKIYEQMPNF